MSPIRAANLPSSPWWARGDDPGALIGSATGLCRGHRCALREVSGRAGAGRGDRPPPTRQTRPRSPRPDHRLHPKRAHHRGAHHRSDSRRIPRRVPRRENEQGEEPQSSRIVRSASRGESYKKTSFAESPVLLPVKSSSSSSGAPAHQAPTKQNGAPRKGAPFHGSRGRGAISRRVVMEA